MWFFLMRSDHSRFAVGDGGNDSLSWFLACFVVDDVFRTKIGEDAAKKTSYIRLDKDNCRFMGVAEIANVKKLLFGVIIKAYNHLEVADEVIA